MDYIGLVFEVIFLGIGIYLYMFARGFLKSANPDLQKRAEDFRLRNQRWLRPLAIAIIAIMAMNIFLHLKEIFGSS